MSIEKRRPLQPPPPGGRSPRKARQVGKWVHAQHIPKRPPEPAIGQATSGRTRWAVTLPLAGEGYENEPVSGTRVIFKRYRPCVQSRS